jgi:hypothetical protein
MAQTLCIKCGSELKVSSYCHLCQEPLVFAYTSCDYITEEKVHTDCRNAEVLTKTETKEEEQPAATATTTAPTYTTGNKEVKTIVDKPKEEETVKAEPSSAPSYMTREQDNKNNNVNPFVIGTEFWQSFMTYWFNAYGEFLKNAPKMTEYWYDTYWKPWLNWMPQQLQRQQEQQDKE